MGNALGPVARAWGDGVGDGRHPRGTHHTIGSIHYGENGGSALQCRLDGEVIAASTPERLADLWQRHGGMQMGGFESRPDEPVTEDKFLRSRDALVDIALLGARCTCTPESDITLCPNYQPGDEEVYPDD